MLVSEPSASLPCTDFANQDLAKKTEDAETKEDLLAGCEAAERVLQKANEAVNRDLLDDALEELIVRVDDWKSHKIESFGKLLLHGIYGVITGKSEQEKDVCLATCFPFIGFPFGRELTKPAV